MGKQPVEILLQVTAAILLESDKVLIARRPAGDRLAGKWEFPGGKIEAGETPQMCLKREMKEEFGIDVAVGEFFGESHCTAAQGPVVLLAYRCAWQGGSIVLTAHSTYRWVRVPELARYDFAPADVPFAVQLMAGE